MQGFFCIFEIVRSGVNSLNRVSEYEKGKKDSYGS